MLIYQRLVQSRCKEQKRVWTHKVKRSPRAREWPIACRQKLPHMYFWPSCRNWYKRLVVETCHFERKRNLVKWFRSTCRGRLVDLPRRNRSKKQTSLMQEHTNKCQPWLPSCSRRAWLPGQPESIAGFRESTSREVNAMSSYLRRKHITC